MLFGDVTDSQSGVEAIYHERRWRKFVSHEHMPLDGGL